MVSSSRNDDDFEISQPMHITNSGDPTDERPGIADRQTVIEKHITEIPNDEDETSSNYNTHGENPKAKIKKHLPGHHSTETTNEHHQKKSAIDSSTTVQQNSHQSSGLEIAGLMPMTMQNSSSSTSTFSSASSSTKNKPRLERHISRIPDDDNELEGEGKEGMGEKLRRKISNVA